MARRKNAAAWRECDCEWQLDYHYGRGPCALPLHADRWLSHHRRQRR